MWDSPNVSIEAIPSGRDDQIVALAMAVSAAATILAPSPAKPFPAPDENLNDLAIYGPFIDTQWPSLAHLRQFMSHLWHIAIENDPSTCSKSCVR